MRPLFGKPIVFSNIDSTNRYLVDEARLGVAEGVVVVADSQTAGRGRRGRSWIAEPRSALLCSMLFRPTLDLEDVHIVPTIVGLAAHTCVGELTGTKPELKWPNDLFIGDKKVAGLLSEVVVVEDGYALVVGIGVNLRWSEGFLSSSDNNELAALRERATTLEHFAGQHVDRDHLLARLLSHIEADYLGLERPGASAHIMDRYRAACSTIGRRVIVEAIDTTYEAEAIDVTDRGRLLVRVGTVDHEIDAADVVHLHADVS